ncbi:hypothetical protein OKW39_008658 [Paraburkholderia sp. MM6662-R1]
MEASLVRRTWEIRLLIGKCSPFQVLIGKSPACGDGLFDARTGVRAGRAYVNLGFGNMTVWMKGSFSAALAGGVER